MAWTAEVRTEDASARSAPTDALREMEAAMHSLAACKPETVRGAREALRVALEILANRAIDQGFSVTMNDGPVLDILGNVYHVLQGIDGDLRPIDD